MLRLGVILLDRVLDRVLVGIACAGGNGVMDMHVGEDMRSQPQRCHELGLPACARRVAGLAGVLPRHGGL